MPKQQDMLGPLIRAIVGVPKNRLGLMLDIANRLNINSEDEAVFFPDLAKFAREWGEVRKQTKVYLRLLAYDLMDGTDGTKTLKNNKLFRGGVHGETLTAISEPTRPTGLAVYEVVGSGNYTELFGSLGEEGELEWTESQADRFFREHNNSLRKYDGTFLRVKGGFVANAHLDGCGRLRLDVDQFSNNRVWRVKHGEYRLVTLVS